MKNNLTPRITPKQLLRHINASQQDRANGIGMPPGWRFAIWLENIFHADLGIERRWRDYSTEYNSEMDRLSLALYHNILAAPDDCTSLPCPMPLQSVIPRS